MAHQFYDPARGATYVTPSPMGEQGTYKYSYRPALRTNGAGKPVRSLYSSAVWTWRWMRHADYVWWINTLLQGQPSKTFTLGGADPSNRTSIENDFTITFVSSMEVYRPTFDYVSGGLYYNVVVEYKNILL